MNAKLVSRAAKPGLTKPEWQKSLSSAEWYFDYTKKDVLDFPNIVFPCTVSTLGKLPQDLDEDTDAFTLDAALEVYHGAIIGAWHASQTVSEGQRKQVMDKYSRSLR